MAWHKERPVLDAILLRPNLHVWKFHGRYLFYYKRLCPEPKGFTTRQRSTIHESLRKSIIRGFSSLDTTYVAGGIVDIPELRSQPLSGAVPASEVPGPTPSS